MTNLDPDKAFLRAFGDRIRAERAGRGMSRKLFAHHAGISERYITQLESGKGNISILLLRQVAKALGLPLVRLVEDESPSPEMTLVRQFLAQLSPGQLHEAHASLAAWFASDAAVLRTRRIALVGLRGAGKTTLGAAVAQAKEVPFFELDREIERLSGTSLGVILEMYGQPAYRRYELLLRHCFTVWIRATPEEHMERVIAQGDRRPMAGSGQAMDDLRRILDERVPLYARADATVDTTGVTETESARELLKRLP